MVLEFGVSRQYYALNVPKFESRQGAPSETDTKTKHLKF